MRILEKQINYRPINQYEHRQYHEGPLPKREACHNLLAGWLETAGLKNSCPNTQVSRDKYSSVTTHSL